jgi:ABC-type transporter Mla subunit MlaD
MRTEDYRELGGAHTSKQRLLVTISSMEDRLALSKMNADPRRDLKQALKQLKHVIVSQTKKDSDLDRWNTALKTQVPGSTQRRGLRPNEAVKLSACISAIIARSK